MNSENKLKEEGSFTKKKKTIIMQRKVPRKKAGTGSQINAGFSDSAIA